jgi:hypothetical protein
MLGTNEFHTSTVEADPIINRSNMFRMMTRVGPAATQSTLHFAGPRGNFGRDGGNCFAHGPENYSVPRQFDTRRRRYRQDNGGQWMRMAEVN